MVAYKTPRLYIPAPAICAGWWEHLLCCQLPSLLAAVYKVLISLFVLTRGAQDPMACAPTTTFGWLAYCLQSHPTSGATGHNALVFLSACRVSNLMLSTDCGGCESPTCVAATPTPAFMSPPVRESILERTWGLGLASTCFVCSAQLLYSSAGCLLHFKARFDRFLLAQGPRLARLACRA